MSRLTWSQRDDRATARRAGLTAAAYIRHALAMQHEADEWARIEGADERVRYWTRKANIAEADAITHARRAMRYALSAEPRS